MSLKVVLFDFGNTLIKQQVDTSLPLGRMAIERLPHARSVLLRLSRKYKLALVTNTQRSSARSVWAALRKLGLAGFFSSVVTSYDVGRPKPGQEMFKEALRRLHAKADEAVMIGNDMGEDIVGASRIGMKTILVRIPNGGPRRGRGTADYVVTSLRDVPGVLARMEVGQSARSRGSHQVS